MTQPEAMLGAKIMFPLPLAFERLESFMPLLALAKPISCAALVVPNLQAPDKVNDFPLAAPS